MTKTAVIPSGNVVNLRETNEFCFCVEVLLLFQRLQNVLAFLFEYHISNLS